MINTQTHIASLNIGRLKADPSDARVFEFMDNLSKINSLGKRSSGFVWMMESESDPEQGNTDAMINGDPRMIANLTVWETVERLKAFTFQTVHNQFFKRRSEWFEKSSEPRFVMWRIAKDHRPSLGEALGRLSHLVAHGDSDHAFGWRYGLELEASDQEGAA